MGDLEIRQLTGEDWPEVLEVSAIAFGEEYTDDDSRAFRLTFPFDRAVGAVERGKIVGTSAVLPFELTLPGRVSVPMGGVTRVAVLPTHRRRGILRRLMQEMFVDMSRHGELVAALFASEGSIYGRFGFGPAASAIAFNLERPLAGFASFAGRASGRIYLLDAGAAASQLPAIYESPRLLQPGATNRPTDWWNSYLADPPFQREGMSRLYHAVHVDEAGLADGYVSYRLKQNWVGEGAMNQAGVVELVAADANSYRALWEYVLETDLVKTITCWRGRVDEPLRWLLADPRRFNVQALFDNLWLRVLDVPRALSARAYGRPGDLVLEIESHVATSDSERFRLQVEKTGIPGVGCAATSGSPDLVLGMVELAAVYLGGVTFAALAEAGRIREMTPGTIELADAMFRARTAPFCSTDF